MDNKKYVTLIVSSIVLLIALIVGVSYAFFNYTKTGESNTIKTAQISFYASNNLLIDVENDFPQDASLTPEELEAMKTSHSGTLSVSANTTLTKGVEYNIYAIKGAEIAGKTRMKDESIKFQLVPNFTSGQNGFTIKTNSYASPTNLSFGANDKILLSTGLVKDISSLSTVSYTYYMWIDGEKVLVSSTTKRETLPEGNPSIADTSSGNVTVGRYMTNTNELSNVTLFPADSSHTGKIVYTTNEFSNGFYNIKIVVEAADATS